MGTDSKINRIQSDIMILTRRIEAMEIKSKNTRSRQSGIDKKVAALVDRVDDLRELIYQLLDVHTSPDSTPKQLSLVQEAEAKKPKPKPAPSSKSRQSVSKWEYENELTPWAKVVWDSAQKGGVKKLKDLAAACGYTSSSMRPHLHGDRAVTGAHFELLWGFLAPHLPDNISKKMLKDGMQKHCKSNPVGSPPSNNGASSKAV